MKSYYNEIDPYAAQWLRNLIDAGHIARGDVDERSIVDVRADDLRGYTQAHFFAGAGGWSIALRLAGWPDDRPVWTGSCPCGPFSAIGEMERFADERHLWPDWVRLIRERSPPVVFGEQVASATEWLRLVRSDLEALGYAVGCSPIEAASAGAEHFRDRFWFVGDAAGLAEREPDHQADAKPVAGRARAISGGTGIDRGLAVVNGLGQGLEGYAGHGHRDGGWPDQIGSAPAPSDEFDWYVCADGKRRRAKSGIRLLADGVPARVAKLCAIGNAIDPRPAAAFIGAAMTLSMSSHNSQTEAG